MSESKKPYTRLTRNVAGVGTYSSLWLGADHLMLVRSTGYGETYSRVQLSEVKGIFITDSARRAWWALPWALLAGVGLAFMILAAVSQQTPIFSVLLFVIGGIGLAWNHHLGPGCRAHVVTAVQTAALPSLVRRKKAIEVIAKLDLLISRAQAHLVVPEEEEDSAPSPTTSTAVVPPLSE